MSIVGLSLNERDPVKQNHAIRQLMEGRSNAVGAITLANNTTTTLVVAPNCSNSSSVFLMPASAGASLEWNSGLVYVNQQRVFNGSFIINHTNSTSTRTYFWAAFG